MHSCNDVENNTRVDLPLQSSCGSGGMLSVAGVGRGEEGVANSDWSSSQSGVQFRTHQVTRKCKSGLCTSLHGIQPEASVNVNLEWIPLVIFYVYSKSPATVATYTSDIGVWGGSTCPELN